MDPYQYQLDDVDRLLARLEWAEPPDHLRAQVMVAVAARARTRQRVGIALVAASLVCMAIFSFLMGQQLASTGAMLLLRGLMLDAEVARLAPTDVALATVELIPWGYLAAVGLGAVGIVLAWRALSRASASPKVVRPGDFV